LVSIGLFGVDRSDSRPSRHSQTNTNRHSVSLTDSDAHHFFFFLLQFGNETPSCRESDHFDSFEISTKTKTRRTFFLFLFLFIFFLLSFFFLVLFFLLLFLFLFGFDRFLFSPLFCRIPIGSLSARLFLSGHQTAALVPAVEPARPCFRLCLSLLPWASSHSI
jgi:hypothetical protein